MKFSNYLSTFMVASAALFIVPAFAQWQVPLGNAPYGRGSGIGFGSTKAFPAAAYGVKCDGTTNDAAKINDAINAAAVTGGSVELPLGTCAISSAIQMKSGVTLKGQGAGMNYAQFGPVVAPLYPTRLLWTGGNIAASMIQTPTVMATNMGIENIALDGQVIYSSLATSNLVGISLGSTFGTKFSKISYQNMGTGLAFVPGFGTAVPALVAWSTFYDMMFSYVGTVMDFTANATMGIVAAGSGGVTNNFFYNTIAYQYLNYGIRFRALADDNRFTGGYITTDVVGSTAIVYNTIDPANPAGTYGNSFLNFEIECNAAGPGTGINSIVVNNTNAFGSTYKGGVFNCPVAPVVNAGGKLTIEREDNNPIVYEMWRSDNLDAGMSLQNTSTGSGASSILRFGNSNNNFLGYIQLNGSTNTSLSGANSFNFANASTPPIGFWVNNAQVARMDGTGLTVGNASVGNTLLLAGQSSGSAVSITAAGVDPNIQINIAGKGTGPLFVQSPLSMAANVAMNSFNIIGAGNVAASTFNGNTLTTGTGTLTLAGGKTLTQSNTLTYTGTDGSTVAFGTGGTVLYGNQTITLSGDVGGSGTTAITTTLATAQPAIHTWALAQTFTVAPVFTAQSGTRTALGLGTAATQNTGTSGANLPFLNGTNTWAGTQTFTLAPVFTDASGSRTALGLGAVLTYGTHLTNSAGASTYNGTAASTIATDATNANTASTIVARDGSGNFSAGTITAALTGTASGNCALTGCTYLGNVNLTTTNPVLALQGGTAAGQGPIQQFTDTTPQNIGAIGKEAAILGSGTSSNFMINAYQTALDLAIGGSIKATLDVSKFNLGSGVSYYTNGTKGVTCSGALTVISSITITSGIITAATGTGGTCS